MYIYSMLAVAPGRRRRLPPELSEAQNAVANAKLLVADGH